MSETRKKYESELKQYRDEQKGILVANWVHKQKEAKQSGKNGYAQNDVHATGKNFVEQAG